MSHFIRAKNLPASIEEIKTLTNNCKTCAECKPRFYKSPNFHLIKSTQPFERLNMDFKGPLPAVSRNQYILTVVDEFSRFPTVIKALSSIFSLFGLPSYVHSDRGPSISEELNAFLNSHNVATSTTTPYNPQGNGQCERYNGIIWKTVSLACKSRNIETKHWESVIPDALHSVWSLLCTSTNATPHQCFFSFPCSRSSTGESMPTWLSKPGPVYLKRHVRKSKYEPLVDEVELLESNPSYAHIRYPNGTISLQ